MNTLTQMNKAMRYIEENLMGEIDFGEMSRIACCSEYHFRRMFSFLAGMPLGEYIRRRKLSIAAILLDVDENKIIDIALQLGYNSPDAFSKAFQAMHGILPSSVKKGNTILKAFPPMTFQLTIKGGNEMEYRIVEKDAFKIVGLKKRITLIFEGVNHQMDSVLQSLTAESIKELKSLCDIEPKGILSVSTNFSERTVEGSELDQYIGVATTKQASDQWDILEIDSANWAVFTVVGEFPKALQDTWARIYAEWFPTSGYELTGGPEILWNESPDTSKPDYKSEIWIPVRKSDLM
ncbi:MAG TPA: AraC family transcriptional regulator [Tissierellaceae bacterium]|nr:AraC family transcriptional regulator [Tissierellaceae bacterium]